MNSWSELQKNLVETNEFIAEIDVETITFTRMGNYKATPYNLEQNLITVPAAKSLKGVWRWWARTAIVGAFDGRVNYKEANKYLNKILGGTGKGEGSSLFRLEISDIKFPINFETNLSQICNEIDKFYEKAKDFLMDQRLRSYLPHNTKVSISLNPSNTVITIEHRNIPLYRYKNFVEGELIKKGPLKDYFVKSQLHIRSKNGRHRIVATLQIPNLNIYPKIPRVKLLLMKRRDNEDDTLNKANIDSQRIMNYLKRVKEEMAVLVSKGLRFKISLYGIRDEEKVNFLLSSFLLSLILGGIGSLTKRAFGSLKLISFRFREGLKIDRGIQEIFQELQDKEFIANELKETLKKLCDITITHAKRLFNISKTQESRSIPIVPSLSNIRIEVIECPSPDLSKIGGAFVKQTWKTKPVAQGRNLHTWILGLPRFQERTKTGYAIKVKRDHEIYEPLRRISSIGARYFKTRSKNFIIVFGLLSEDWPKDLWHIRSKNQPDYEKLVKEIPNGNSLQKVFDYAFEKVISLVCK
ncbi:MAG: type III-B CRISPR module RAMP protein Cmr1 [Nitrososphaerota archaeon]|nr:type III-B CRISPR module RAMP protein Cmr1 [Nitrososphaerota archaeon]